MQLGNAAWELYVSFSHRPRSFSSASILTSPLKNDSSIRYLLEHGLKPDGRPDPDAQNVGELGSHDTFFSETRKGKWVPRSIFVDLDPSVRLHNLADISTC